MGPLLPQSHRGPSRTVTAVLISALVASACVTPSGSDGAEDELQTTVSAWSSELAPVRTDRVVSSGEPQTLRLRDVALNLPENSITPGSEVRLTTLRLEGGDDVLAGRASALPGPVLVETDGELLDTVELRVRLRRGIDATSVFMVSFDERHVGWTLEEVEVRDGFVIAPLNEFSVKEFFLSLTDAAAYGVWWVTGNRYRGDRTCAGDVPSWVDRFITQSDYEPASRFPQAPVLACVEGDEDVLSVRIINNRNYPQVIDLPADARIAAFDVVGITQRNGGDAVGTIRDITAHFVAENLRRRDDGTMLLAPLASIELELPRRRATSDQAFAVAGTGDWLAPGVYRQTITTSEIDVGGVLIGMLFDEIVSRLLKEAGSSLGDNEEVVKALAPVVACFLAQSTVVGNETPEALAVGIVDCVRAILVTYAEQSAQATLEGRMGRGLDSRGGLREMLSAPAKRLELYRRVVGVAAVGVDMTVSEGIPADLFLLAERVSDPADSLLTPVPARRDLLPGLSVERPSREMIMRRVESPEWRADQVSLCRSAVWFYWASYGPVEKDQQHAWAYWLGDDANPSLRVSIAWSYFGGRPVPAPPGVAPRSTIPAASVTFFPHQLFVYDEIDDPEDYENILISTPGYGIEVHYRFDQPAGTLAVGAFVSDATPADVC